MVPASFNTKTIMAISAVINFYNRYDEQYHALPGKLSELAVDYWSIPISTIPHTDNHSIDIPQPLFFNPGLPICQGFAPMGSAC